MLESEDVGTATLVVDFLNTVDVDEGTDLLDSPDGWRDWAAQRDLLPGSLNTVRELRDALRDAVDGRPATLPPIGLTARATDRGVVLHGTDAAAAVLAVAVALTDQGGWDRVKLCPAHDCRWAFYDRSKNRSRTWCSMAGCGNRAKARGYRDRTRTVRTGDAATRPRNEADGTG